ncbi:MAG: arylesterase [Deferrisomatales bacterium]|nr:arylesterase [Deferrisomatales bacterium]
MGTAMPLRLSAHRHLLRLAPAVGLLGRIALCLAFVNAAAAAEPLRILALGDSLTAGYGLPAQAAFPAVLEAALRREGVKAVVINGGVSGDTSAGGLARLEWALGRGADLAVVALGANDALRGLDPAAMEANLDAILSRLRERGVRVLLAGMKAPRNLGPAYVREFDAVFPRLAARHGVALYPFFLEGVAGIPGLNQADGVHPNRRGVEEMVARVLPLVRELVREIGPRGG